MGSGEGGESKLFRGDRLWRETFFGKGPSFGEGEL